MHVTLCCDEDEFVIWFAEPLPNAREIPVGDHANVRLVLDEHKVLKGVRLLGLRDVCPYELAKVARVNAGQIIKAELRASYDSSCNMGYVYLDYRGPGSVAETVPTDFGLNIDIGKDGNVVGLEVFSASRILPELATMEPRT